MDHNGQLIIRNKNQESINVLISDLQKHLSISKKIINPYVWIKSITNEDIKISQQNSTFSIKVSILILFQCYFIQHIKTQDYSFTNYIVN